MKYWDKIRNVAMAILMLAITCPGVAEVLVAPRPNGWPSKSSYPNRWLHSDMKDVSYYFNFKFYEKIIEKGNLR